MMLDFPDIFYKYQIKTEGVLHIGASTGQEAELYDSFGIHKMIFIEAIPKVYEELTKKLGMKYTEAIAVNACISDVDDKEVVFNISNNESQSSSFLPLGHHLEIHPSVKYIDKINLKTKRIDTLITEQPILNLEGYKLLNIDVQGAELQVLKGMGELLGNFDYAFLEINQKETYIGCALVEEIDAYMKQYGFERVETGKWVADTWTDGFYIKQNLL